jgi:thiamine pyrophosphokinase
VSRCIIFAAGEYYNNSICIQNGDFIIAADAGLEVANSLRITPRLVIGDFDSIKSNLVVDGVRWQGCEIIRLAPEKDETDTAAALREAQQRGYREFHIYGGTGGRLDHTLANIQCLANLAQKGQRGFLYGNGIVVTALHDGQSLCFEAVEAGVISIFASSAQANGVTLRGLKYPLADAVLTNDVPLGVSNAFIGKEASVSLRQGTLIVVYPDSVTLR